MNSFIFQAFCAGSFIGLGNNKYTIKNLITNVIIDTIIRPRSPKANYYVFEFSIETK